MQQLNVVITGANSGIGLQTTKKYLSLGHQVLAVSRNTEQLEQLQAKYPSNLHIYKCDVSHIKSLAKVYKAIISTHSTIDILIANAGIAKAQELASVTEQSFDEHFNINVKGLFFTVQSAIPHLSKNAAVLLIGSIQSKRGSGSWAVYGATKASVRSLTRSFAEALGKQGVRVNCISPGVTDTPILQKFGFDKSSLQEIVKQVELSTPLGRLGTPQEIADCIYFVCSQQASFMTGADIQVDGGLAQI